MKQNTQGSPPGLGHRTSSYEGRCNTTARYTDDMSPNYIIYALGMKGEVIDAVFVPYRERDGSFPIFSEALQRANKSARLQNAENKIAGVVDIAEAVRLIRAGGHRWRLKEYETGQCNIYKGELIVIREV